MSFIRDAWLTEIPALQSLLREYEEQHGVDLCFQQFEAELPIAAESYLALELRTASE